MEFSILKEKIMPALFGGLAILLVSFFAKLTPGSAIIFAYLAAILIGYLCSLIPNVQIAAAVGVFTVIVFMVLTNNVHPPAGGAVLAFIFSTTNLVDLVYVVLSLLILLIVLKTIIYLYKKELHIEKFHHEFIK